MILQIFSVYDEKAKAYLAPFFMPQVGQAVRIFANMANDQDHAFGNNPEDYTLYQLGELDDSTGAIGTQHTMITTALEQSRVEQKYGPSISHEPPILRDSAS